MSKSDSTCVTEFFVILSFILYVPASRFVKPAARLYVKGDADVISRSPSILYPPAVPLFLPPQLDIS